MSTKKTEKDKLHEIQGILYEMLEECTETYETTTDPAEKNQAVGRSQVVKYLLEKITE